MIGEFSESKEGHSTLEGKVYFRRLIWGHPLCEDPLDFTLGNRKVIAETSLQTLIAI